MAIEITSLFRDILESPEQKQQRQMAEGFARSQNAVSQLTGLATAAAPLVGTMAELQGRRTEALQRGTGRLLGRDVRSTSEKLQSALSQFNPQDPASVSQTTQMLQQMGLGAQGAQLAAMALEEQQRKAAVDLQTEAARQTIDINQAGIDLAAKSRQTLIDNRPRLQSIVDESSLPESKKRAVVTAVNAGAYDSQPDKLIEIVFPGDQERYKAVGKAVFDSRDGVFITAPAGTATPEEFMSEVDPDQYDPASVTAFMRAQYSAQTPEEQAQAYTVLRPKAVDGYQWSAGFNDNNEEVQIQRPINGSSQYQEVVREMEAANASAERVINNSTNTVQILDKMISALENNEVETGIQGILLKYVPGTNEANISADLETAYSNLGIGELESMRAASANGASGFGQLTAPELSMLKTRVRNLTQSQDRQQQVDNMKYVRNMFMEMGNKAKTDWTVDEWIGVSPRPEQAATESVQTPSGTFTIVPR